MRILCLIFPVLMTSCSLETAEKVSGNAKALQAFRTYTVGNYSFSKDCDTPGMTDLDVIITEDSFRANATRCKIDSVQISTDPFGPLLTLKRCEGAAVRPDNTEVIIASNGNGETYLHGWNRAPVQLFQCQ